MWVTKKETTQSNIHSDNNHAQLHPTNAKNIGILKQNATKKAKLSNISRKRNLTPRTPQTEHQFDIAAHNHKHAALANPAKRDNEGANMKPTFGNKQNSRQTHPSSK